MLKFVILSVLLLPAGDWPQFRGPAGLGSADGADLPIEWRADVNVAWRRPLPGKGLAGPIIVAGRVILTAASGPNQDRLHVLAFDAESGERIWERQIWATGRTDCHDASRVAAPTPCSDGERIFALFSSNDVVCLDLAGNLLWLRGLTYDYANASNSLGLASSPIVAGNSLIALIENEADSFAVGLDMETGVNLWKVPRPLHANWTTPAAVAFDSGPVVVFQSPAGLDGYDPRTGNRLWHSTTPAESIPSLLAVGRRLFVPADGVTALVLESDGEAPRVQWSSNRLRAATPTPLVYRDRVYTVNGAGILNCGDGATGKPLWQLRLRGKFTASPIAADGRIYLFNDEGVGYVVATGESGELLGTNPLDEVIYATPAIADGALFVRSDAHLWKISRQ